MTRAEIQALLERRLNAFNEHDVEALTSQHTEDGVVDSQMAGTITGHDEIARVYRAYFAAFPDLVITTEDLVIDGDRAVLVTTSTGTDHGSFMGVPATHKPFRVPVVFLYTFREGRIAYERRLSDFTGLLVQIGVLKAKPA